MTIAPGPDQANKSSAGVSGSPTRGKQPQGRWKHREDGWRAYEETATLPAPRADRAMGLVDALKVQALISHHACQAQLTARQYRVLMAVMGHLLRWQRLEAQAAAALLSRFSGVPQSTIGLVLKELHELGFIEYRPGVGKAKNRVRVIVPEGWEAAQGGWVSASTGSADSSESEDSTDSEESESSKSDESASTESEESESSDSADGSGGSFGRTSTGSKGGGEAVALPARDATSTPSPGGPEVAQSVLAAYCKAMTEAGTPVVKSEALLPGIRSALRAGYSPRSVLIGLGMWDSEGFRSPRQIEEWVQKAARQGPEPSHPMSVPDLLAEGHTRYRAHLARKALATPSKAEVRRQRSLAALREFIQ